MPVLTWDGTGAKRYESGDDHAVLYVMDDTTHQYGTGVPWNGITGVTESPSGADANDLYADNIKYATLRGAENFGITIEAYTYPDEWAQCDGSETPVAGVRLGQQGRKTFGFVYRSKIGNDQSTDLGYLYHIIYGLTASPSERAYTTINDSPDAITFSWECSSVPAAVTGTNYKAVSCITVDTTKFTDTAGKAALAALETLLFGGTGESATAQLPNPVTVLTTLGWTAPTT